jgi:secretion/DNA translocation related CpaE-like protein
MLPQPTLVTEDADLLDDLLRLAAVAGVEPTVADPLAVRSGWRTAPVLVIGADAAAACVRAQLPRRAGVLVACRGPADLPVWARAVRLGAEQVVELPAGERVLVEALSGVPELAGPPGPVVSVLAGRGGAGASVLAAALAVTAARSGRAPLLVDADPMGGGLDVLLGAEAVAGLRWPDLAGTAGRLSATALRGALPVVAGVPVLSAGRDGPVELPALAVRAVLDAGRRCADPVIVDISRAVGAAAEAALGESAGAILVVPGELRAVAAASRVAGWARQHGPDLQIVVRMARPGGLAATDVGAALDLPVAGELAPESGLAAALERGEPPPCRARGPLARLCGRLLADLPGGGATSPAGRAGG